METVRSGTQAQLALERGVDASRVSRYKKQGLLAFLPDGHVDLDESHRRIDQKLNRAKGRRRNGNVTSTSPSTASSSQPTPPAPIAPEKSAEEVRYWAARAAKEEEDRKQAALKTLKDDAETRIAVMKADQLAGTLVYAAGVEAERRESGRALRNSVLAVPDRLAQVLDPANPERARKLLHDELEKALSGLSAQFDARAAEAARTEEPGIAVL